MQPMQRRPRFSALQMAVLSALGGLLLASGFLLTIPLHRQLGNAGWVRRALLIFVPLLSGAVLTFVAEASLRRGLKDGRWPSADILSLRGLLESAVVKAVSCTFLLVSIGGFLLAPHRYKAVGWALLIVLQTLLRLQTLVHPRPQASGQSHGKLDWRSIPPIRSEHWGQR